MEVGGDNVDVDGDVDDDDDDDDGDDDETLSVSESLSDQHSLALIFYLPALPHCLIIIIGIKIIIMIHDY